MQSSLWTERLQNDVYRAAESYRHSNHMCLSSSVSVVAVFRGYHGCIGTTTTNCSRRIDVFKAADSWSVFLIVFSLHSELAAFTVEDSSNSDDNLDHSSLASCVVLLDDSSVEYWVLRSCNRCFHDEGVRTKFVIDLRQLHLKCRQRHAVQMGI